MGFFGTLYSPGLFFFSFFLANLMVTVFFIIIGFGYSIVMVRFFFLVLIQLKGVEILGSTSGRSCGYLGFLKDEKIVLKEFQMVCLTYYNTSLYIFHFSNVLILSSKIKFGCL